MLNIKVLGEIEPSFLKTLRSQSKVRLFNAQDVNSQYDVLLCQRDQVSTECLRQYLNSGRTVAVHNPDEKTGEVFANEVGVSCPKTNGLMAIRKPKVLFQGHRVPYTQCLAVNIQPDRDGSHSAYAAPGRKPEVSPKENAIELPVQSPTRSEQDLDMVNKLIEFSQHEAEIMESLIPPYGAKYAIVSQHSISYKTGVAPLSWKKQPQRTQWCSGEKNLFFYIYLENGGGYKNRYQVYLVESGTARHPGLVNNHPDLRFMKQHTIETSIQETSKIKPVKQSKSPGVSLSPIQTSLRLEMRILIKDSGLKDVVWVAQKNQVIELPGWGVNEQGKDKHENRWIYHQNEHWNPISQWDSWLSMVFDKKFFGWRKVKPFPNPPSYSNFDFETHSTFTYQFSNSGRKVANYSSSVGVDLAGFSNPKEYKLNYRIIYSNATKYPDHYRFSINISIDLKQVIEDQEKYLGGS